MKRIVIAGGSGFLGQTLASFFAPTHDVVLLSRHHGRTPFGRVVPWDGATIGPWKNEIEGAAAIINLAGKSVDCRYTRSNQAEILRSRLEPTRAIGRAINLCARPPGAWLNASTATIYKHTFGAAHDESGAIGAAREANDRFSVAVAEAWEAACRDVPTSFTRKVLLRSAMVLGHGGNSVLPTLAKLVRLGLGGRMGSGRQFVSWIHHEDFSRAVQWLIEHPVQGVFNLAAPNPLPNAEMMRSLRAIVRVPIGIPSNRFLLEIGAFVLRTETELILKSRRVIPAKLLSAGFVFKWDRFEAAAAHLLANNAEPALAPETQLTRPT